MLLEFSELAANRFKDEGFDVHEIRSSADQHAFLTAQEAEVEKVAPRGGGWKHEEPGEIIVQEMIVKDNDEDWDLERILTAEEAKPLDCELRCVHCRRNGFSQA